MPLGVRLFLSGLLFMALGLLMLFLQQHFDPGGTYVGDPNYMWIVLTAYSGLALLILGFPIAIVGGIVTLVVPKEDQ